MAGSPYLVTGDVTVAGGLTLTIEAGVVVKFNAVDTSAAYGSRDSYYYRNELIVDGTLEWTGTVFDENLPWAIELMRFDELYGSSSDSEEDDLLEATAIDAVFAVYYDE